MRSVFGDRTERVLLELKISFIPGRGMYMGIRDDDGNIAVGSHHLKTSPTRILYLDVIHELFHINQRMADPAAFHREHMKFMEDRSLYYASPIEIPAYAHTVREAERIGMSREEILEYLKIGDAPPEIWRAFVRAMGLTREKASGKSAARERPLRRFPVRIRRDAKATLHNFSDYFIGFDRAGTVRELLGERSPEFLGDLRVEFVDSPFPMILPSDEDGHLVVAGDYFRTGRTDSIYLDVYFCLYLLKTRTRFSIFDPSSGLDNNPSLLGAYSALVSEAKRLGLSEEEILEHLQLLRFVLPETAFAKFLRELGLNEKRNHSIG